MMIDCNSVCKNKEKLFSWDPRGGLGSRDEMMAKKNIIIERYIAYTARHLKVSIAHCFLISNVNGNPLLNLMYANALAHI